MNTKPELLTKSATAQFVGVSERTLDRWNVLRKGPARITVGRKILYRQEAVLNWLKDNETAPIGTFL